MDPILNVPLFLPLAIVTAITGPGIITPERDIITTEKRNRGTFRIGSIRGAFG